MKTFKHLPFNKLMWFVLFFLLPVGLAFNVNLIAPLTDSFHEGEYLGNLQNLHNYYEGLSGFPILIHGAMDYLPSMAARMIADGDHLLVWTRFLNVLAVAVCWVLYLDLSRVVLREQSEKYVWGLLFFILFVWMAVAAGDDPVRKQQAFLGTRDLFLMLSLWAGVRALYCRCASGVYVCLIASGVFAGLSLYWSYDRGVLSAVWVICFAIALLYQRQRAHALAIVLAYTAGLLSISQTSGLGSLLENFNNIIYWIKNTGDVWFILFKYKLPAILGALAMAVFALAVMFHSVLKTIRQGPQKTLPLVLGLVLVQLVFLTKLYSLPGYPTSYYFIWPTFLLLILTPPTSALLSEINNSLDRLLAHVKQLAGVLGREDKKILLGAGVLLLVLCSNAIVSGLVTAKQLARPLSDKKLIDNNRYGFDAVAGNTFNCVFQWSNEGIFSLLSKKPYCTQYAYAVYISRGNEASALNELKNNPPGLIVYDSPFWSMEIYGRHMRNRLPAIDRFIQENYVFHNSGNGYVYATPKLYRGLK